MPKRDDDDKFEFIPVDEDIAEWMKDPEFVKLTKESATRMQREIRAHKARVARKKRRKALKAFKARVQSFWADITRGIDGGVL